MKTHVIEGRFVSADLKAHTLAFRSPDGDTMTVPLRSKAERDVAALAFGDRIQLTCMDNDQGEHQGITAVRRAAILSERGHVRQRR